MAPRFDSQNSILTWSDYPVIQEPPPANNSFDVAAYTHTDWSYLNIQHYEDAKGCQVILDNFSVSVAFDKKSSYVKSWALQLKKPQPDQLLTHENGHYLIVRNLCKRFYDEIVSYQGKVFPNAHAWIVKQNSIVNHTVGKIEQVNANYDKDVHPEMKNGMLNGPHQQQWNNTISHL